MTNWVLATALLFCIQNRLAMSKTTIPSSTLPPSPNTVATTSPNFPTTSLSTTSRNSSKDQTASLTNSVPVPSTPSPSINVSTTATNIPTNGLERTTMSSPNAATHSVGTPAVEYKNDFIVVYDKTNQTLLKIHFSGPSVILQKGVDVGATAINPLNGDIYWYDRSQTNALFVLKSNDNNEAIKLSSTTDMYYISSLAIEPLTGNIYFVNSDSETINVMNGSGNFGKRITEPPNEHTILWKTSELELDIVNRHLYWIASDGYGAAELRRIGFDGKNQTTVIRYLHVTTHIIINNKEQLLYLIDQHLPVNGGNRSKGRLYEIPISSLANFTTDIPINAKVYNINFPSNSNHYIEKFVVSKSTLYFIAISNSFQSLKKVDLRQSLNQPEQINVEDVQNGVATPVTISSFTSSEKNFIATLKNPCEDSTCEELCLISPPDTFRCECRDGFSFTESACQPTSPISLPPTFGNTCPENFVVTTLPCHPEPSINLTAPTWTDDITSSSALNLTTPNNTRDTYPPDQYTFIYTATDSDGNTGYCSFEVTVASQNCSANYSTLSFSSPVELLAPVCEDGKQVIKFRCKNPSFWIRYQDQLNETFINTCRDNLEYDVPDFSLFKCEPKPDLTTSGSSSSPTTTTTTITSTASTANSKTTTATHINKNATTISGNQDPITTMNNKKVRRKRRNKSLNKGGVAAIVLVILVTGISVVIFFVVRKRRRNRSSNEDRAAILTWQNEEASDATDLHL